MAVDFGFSGRGHVTHKYIYIYIFLRQTGLNFLDFFGIDPPIYACQNFVSPVFAIFLKTNLDVHCVQVDGKTRREAGSQCGENCCQGQLQQ